MYGLKQTVAPTILPVSVAELKNHLRIDDDERNTELERIIKAATRFVEREQGRQLITATWQFQIAAFPLGRRPIFLPLAPLLAVSSLVYLDTNEDEQSFDYSTKCVVANNRQPGMIQPKPSYFWPTTAPRIDAVTITYTAGYGATAASVPETTRQAILLLAGHFYEQREETTEKLVRNIPLGVERLLRLESIGDEFIRYEREYVDTSGVGYDSYRPD